MRRVRYSVVMSLDGYIAGPKGEADWITTDPDFDFAAIFSKFDTILVGRRTFETMVAARHISIPGMKTIVFSKTLKQEDRPQAAIVANNQQETLAALKASRGSLFRSLAEAGLVDTVEVRIVPILLGAGVPLSPEPKKRIKLALKSHKVY
jgi:dihydrofolate reductase